MPVNVDWLRTWSPEPFIEVLGIRRTDISPNCKPLFGAAFGFEVMPNLKVFTFYQDKGHVIEANGEWCREHQQDVRPLAATGRVARIDLADDDWPWTIKETVEAIRGGLLVPHAHKAVYWEDLNTGKATLYLGSRASDRYARIYDLRHLSGGARLELELKHQSAWAVGSMVAANDVLDRNGCFGPLFKRIPPTIQAWLGASSPRLAAAVKSKKVPKPIDWETETTTLAGKLKALRAIHGPQVLERMKWAGVDGKYLNRLYQEKETALADAIPF